MADIVTGTVTGQVDVSQLLIGQSDIRREQEQIGADVRRETAKEAGDLTDAVKTAAWANSDRTGTEADRVVAQDTAYFIAGQSQNFANATSLASLKASQDAQFNQTLSAIQLAAQQTAAAATLAGSKAEAASALGQALIGQQIVQDGNSTRALVNELKMAELNRMLVERNAEIVESRCDGRYWAGKYNNSQTEALSSQINALHSQFQAATQGTVNFGTMSGNAGRNTSTNNVV